MEVSIMHDGQLVTFRTVVQSVVNQQPPGAVRSLVNEFDHVRGSLGRNDDAWLVGGDIPSPSHSAIIQSAMDESDTESEMGDIPVAALGSPSYTPRNVMVLSENPRVIIDLSESPVAPPSVESPSPIAPPHLESAGRTPPPVRVAVSDNFVPIMKACTVSSVGRTEGNPISFLCTFWNAPSKWHFESVIPQSFMDEYYTTNHLTRDQLYKNARIARMEKLPYCTNCFEVFATSEEAHFEKRYCECLAIHHVCKFCVADEALALIICSTCRKTANRKRARDQTYWV
jgi:hypothetical protein